MRLCVFAGLFRPLLQLTCMDRVLCAKNYSFTSNSGDFFTLYGRRASLAYWPRGSAFGLTECALHKQLFTRVRSEGVIFSAQHPVHAGQLQERPKESSEHTQPLSASAVRFFADWSAVPRPSTGVKKYRCARFKVDSVPTVTCKS